MLDILLWSEKLEFSNGHYASTVFRTDAKHNGAGLGFCIYEEHNNSALGNSRQVFGPPIRVVSEIA